MKDCIFCKIVKGEVPSKKVLENEKAEVHLLIMPKEHIESIMHIQNSDFFGELVMAAKELIKKNNIENGYKLMFNGGKYQAIPHLHWHLLGGKLEDESDILNQT